MDLLDLVQSGSSDLSKRPAHATLEELDSILDCNISPSWTVIALLAPCSQLKDAWIAYISKHFTQSSAGPSANPSKVATSQGSPCGAGGGGAD